MKTVTFDNGFRVVLRKTENVMTCALGIWAASGSAYETPETAGTAHFIEHMVFKGTGKRSALDIARETNALGSEISAYTAREYTCFYAKCLSEHSAAILDIICDMLTDPKFSPADIETEKGVIAEEFSMYEDDPEELCSDTFIKNIWKGSMLGYDILGTRENVAAMTREKLTAHMKKYYAPGRMVASICGNFDENELVEICRKYFGSLPGTEFKAEPAGADFSKSISLVKKDSSQNQLVIGFPGIRCDDPRRHTAAVISSILGASTYSRLFQRLREELGLVYSVDSANTKQEKAGFFAIYMALSPKSEKRAIEETVKIISAFPGTVTEDELKIAVEQGVSGYVMECEGISNTAEKNGLETLFYNRVDPVDEVVKRIRSVTLDDVKKLSAEMLDMKKVSLCAVGKVKSKQTYKKYLETV